MTDFFAPAATTTTTTTTTTTKKSPKVYAEDSESEVEDILDDSSFGFESHEPQAQRPRLCQDNDRNGKAKCGDGLLTDDQLAASFANSPSTRGFGTSSSSSSTLRSFPTLRRSNNINEDCSLEDVDDDGGDGEAYTWINTGVVGCHGTRLSEMFSNAVECFSHDGVDVPVVVKDDSADEDESIEDLAPGSQLWVPDVAEPPDHHHHQQQQQMTTNKEGEDEEDLILSDSSMPCFTVTMGK